MTGSRFARVAATLALLVPAHCDRSPARVEDPAPRSGPALSSAIREDLDGLLERREIRVLVVPNRTHYFIDQGTERGLSHDAFTLFSERLNRGRSASAAVHVAFIPVPGAQLLQALNDGRGDVAAANLTRTAEREREVAFTDPVFANVREIIVTGPASPQLSTLADLSGKTVHVRLSTSYHESLVALNERFRAEGRAPMRLVLLPEEFANEDDLEMLNAGLIGIAVVEDYLAEFWKQVFPDIELHPELVVRDEGSIAWAVRKENPKLLAELNRFLASDYRDGSTARNVLLKRYLQDTTYLRNALSKAELRRFAATLALFRKYGAQYGFDHLMLMAQGYQESRLDQALRSPGGAIGIMQVMPATGRALDVGDIRKADANVHAGALYLRSMIDRYFSDPALTELDRVLFGWAAYNAGPARVAALREEAARSGYDPNVWFRNVELIAAQRIGRETVQYVSGSYKYYVAYKLNAEEIGERSAAKRSYRGH